MTEDAGLFSAKKRHVITYASGGDTTEEALSVYNCAACGELALVLRGAAARLGSFPARTTADNSRAVPAAAIAAERMADAGNKLIRRERGVELQSRLACRNCRLRLAYRCKHAEATLFVLDGALAMAHGGDGDGRRGFIRADRVDGVRVVLCVSPTAASPARIASVEDDFLVVEVSRPQVFATDATNAELVALLSALIDIDPSRVTLVSGATARIKEFAVRGISVDFAERRLLGVCVAKDS